MVFTSSPVRRVSRNAYVQQQTGSTSFNSIAGALVPAILFSSAYVVGWLILRGYYKSQYAPRTYSKVIPEKDRTPSSADSGVSWYKDYSALDDKFILRHHSFDAFLFLRFFRMLVTICGVGCLLTWPILFPVNATGGGNNQQLDRLAFGNVSDPRKCWAHAVVAILFLGFVMLMVTRERVFLISLRQAYVCTKAHATRLSSRTVMFLSVPQDVFENGHFERIFGEKIQRTWKIADLDDLKGLVEERADAVYSLEDAELTLAQNVVRQKRHKNNRTSANGSALERGEEPVMADPENRPHHRSPPLVGQKLDSIDHILKKIPDLNQKIDDLREKYSKEESKDIKAVFIEFKDQYTATQAYQQVQHHSPLSLQPRAIGIPPNNVNWSNLTIDPALRITYGYTAIAVVIATTIFWSIPIGLVGTISNVKYLAENVKWLAWINKLPGPVLAVLQGFIPPFALSYLTSYVPFWFRYVAEQAGAPTKQSAEAFTQRSFFTFQFIQVFLVTTLSSGAATIVSRVANEPGKVPEFLAANLPKASNFYITYFILQGLNSCSGDLIKYEDVLEYLFYKSYWTKTPRQKYELETQMKGLFYGSKYPKFTNMAAIAIVYSCIAPLVLGFATIGFAFFYLTQRYLLLYTNNAKLETKGACHARALQQILTGVYVAELCLIGLFGILNSKGPSIVMSIFFVLTALQHYTINKYLGPLEDHVPLDILQDASERYTDDSQANDHDEESTEPLLSHTSSYPRTESHRPYRHSLPIPLPIPGFLQDPLQRLLPPYILPSFSALQAFLSPSDNDEGGSWMQPPTYTDAQLDGAYKHPAMKEKAPVVWIPKDDEGVSEELKKRNAENAKLETSDEGASLDRAGHLRWDEEDLSKAPIFKLPTRF